LIFDLSKEEKIPETKNTNITPIKTHIEKLNTSSPDTLIPNTIAHTVKNNIQKTFRFPLAIKTTLLLNRYFIFP